MGTTMTLGRLPTNCGKQCWNLIFKVLIHFFSDTAFVLFSWPSLGQTFGDWYKIPNGFFNAYVRDSKRMSNSVPLFAPLLVSLAKLKGAQLHVMGHSMGGQCLFEIMDNQQLVSFKLGTLFFIAADISKHSFKKQYTSYISGKAYNVVNYYCTEDEALKHSSSIIARGPGASVRLGTDHATDPKLVNNPSMSNIRVTKSVAALADSSHYHTYMYTFAVANDILAQLKALPGVPLDPSQRGLPLLGTPPQIYWQISKKK